MQRRWNSAARHKLTNCSLPHLFRAILPRFLRATLINGASVGNGSTIEKNGKLRRIRPLFSIYLKRLCEVVAER
jgi:tRNA(Ile)-lysidine synthase TilS/MesJ